MLKIISDEKIAEITGFTNHPSCVAFQGCKRVAQVQLEDCERQLRDMKLVAITSEEAKYLPLTLNDCILCDKDRNCEECANVVYRFLAKLEAERKK